MNGLETDRCAMSVDPVEVPYRTRAGSFDLFYKRYQPKENADGSLIFDWDDVKGMNYRYVWTVVEAENKMYLSPGFHIVDRIGYVIAQKPWGSMESYCPGYRYA